MCRSFQETTETAESSTLISISPSSAVNLSPPLTSDPAFVLPFPLFQTFFGRGHPWPFLCGIILTSPQPPPLQPAIIQRSSLSVSAFFFFFFSRDLPPQSHKSTEDRCLLCLIKALPPGVIPQFEQEEKPSKGGMFWINPMKGPYYTLSFRFHQRETASQRS